MKIKAKSRKGANKIREGLGDEVVVILNSHPSNPPAVLVAPIGDPSLSSKFVRWINLEDDPNFEIVNQKEK